MSAGVFTLYDHMAESLEKKLIDLLGDTLKIQLHTSAYTPNGAHTASGDLTNQVANANGYLTGGLALSNKSIARTNGLATFTSDAVVWTAAGGSITARYAVLLDTTANKLIGYAVLDNTPADVTVTDTNTLTVGPDVTNGWFQTQVNP